ncbi:hypothetical protein Bca52824_069160 [Brassica carinata]|uniref:Uncharacterized protein n=1 Tax=Brassica carinata TaxID=52824 RepID=A0A8X7U2P0_BRACI|nr:hypothetical protein Bca52824_069160 [Brassica carinata]
MQEKLIHEEEEEKAKRGTIEKERKSKKKQKTLAEEEAVPYLYLVEEAVPYLHLMKLPMGHTKGMFQTGKPRVGVERKTPRRKVSGANSLATETEDQPSRHASNHKSQSHSSETRRVVEAEAVISRIQEAHNPREHNPVSKDRGMVQTKEKSPAVFSPPKASPWNLPSVAQAKPEERGVFNVDTVPNRKAISSRSPLSDQASPSRDIQFHTVGSRAAVQKTTSPIPSLSRPLRAPTVSAARTSTTSFARSVSSTGRVSAPTHSQNYIPPSYKHAVVGSLSSDHSSSHSTGTSALLSVSNQSGFPIDVGSADVWSGGLLRTGGSSSNRDTTQSLMTDEFPHHGIINDLLEEEHGLMITSGYLRFPQWLNDVYSFLANMEISGRSRSYSNDGFKQSYMSGSSSSSSSLYGNGQMDGLTRQTRANMDL